jgi:hypothetical protein
MTRDELKEKISDLEQLLAKVDRRDTAPAPRPGEKKVEKPKFEYEEDLFDNMPV